MYRDGRLLENIEFVRGPGILQVVNALSPVATASLAMGERIAGMTLHRA